MNQFDEDLAYQLEQSPFSEEFSITWEAGDDPVWLAATDGTKLTEIAGGVAAVRGIFDESVEREEGNNAIRKKPRLSVYRWIHPMPQGTRVTVRGKEYTAVSFDKDANMGIVVWLR
jgi:hypothetical protein